MSPPGRPKGEFRSAQHEGTPVSGADGLDFQRLPSMPADKAAELFHQLGLITQRLQHALGQIDALPQLQQSALGLPGARNRLDEVAAKNFQAADKVLTAVEQAKQERERIRAAAVRLLQSEADRHAVRDDVTQIEAAAARIDAHLTDIMVAQDFHDLSGQMLAQVAALAIELEAGLVQLLQGCEPLAPAPAESSAGLARSQREVDELLASHGV